jgi:signal transduction histidine kinase
VVPDAVPEDQREAQRLVSIVGPPPDAVEGDNIVMQVQAAPAMPRVADADVLRRRLLILMQVAEAAGSTLELDELLRRILDYVFEVLPAERGILLLRDEDGNLAPSIIRLRSGGDESSVAVSRNIVEQATSRHVTILTEDALTDQRFRDASSIHDLRIHAALCAPLVHRGEAIGAIYLDTSSDTEVFGPDSVDLINAIAPQAAAAIANARLFTQLRSAYDELRQTQDQLVQAAKLSTIGTLAASIAHDMANIVAPLGAIAARLQRGSDPLPREREIAAAQVRRLNAMIRRLTSFARPHETQLHLVAVDELVAATVAMVETEARHRRVQVEASVPEGLPAVLGDAGQLEQALLNLLVNAVEVSSEGDTITVAAGLDGPDLTISVRDHGPGLPQDAQQRLFEPFFTTKDQGTGLGLYSARRIVQEEHGGVLEFDSPPGGGATVTIRLPIPEASSEPEEAGPAAPPSEAAEGAALGPGEPGEFEGPTGPPPPTTDNGGA